MAIAVIGTGNMGSGLARALARQGVDVVLGARDAAKAQALSVELGTRVHVATPAEAAQACEIVVLALHYAVMAEAVADLGDLTGKVLVDISNPFTPDYKNLVLGTTTSAAEVIQAAAPGAHVVKAVNTVFAGLLPQEARQGAPVQVFVAGDDASAKQQVQALASTIGFEPVDAGPLSNSRFLEPVGEMNIHFGFFLGWGTAVAPAWVRVGGAT